MKKYESSFIQLLAYYKRNARNAGIKFNLSHDQFQKLISSDCTYCGAPPSKVVKKLNNVTVYNGIDRISPDGGYTINNAASCCKKCNFLKGSLSVDDFLSQVHAIFKNLLA